MPYLTPQALPESDDCRSLSIPADTEWLALFGGALTELLFLWNWEQSDGGLTPTETVLKMQELIDAWYDSVCGACELPDGDAVLRLNENGVIQELRDGSWQEPTGAYYLPPPDARTEPTSEERRCLAAANAEKFLEDMYEELTDAFGEGLAAIEALAALVVLVATFIPALGLAVRALGAIAWMAWNIGFDAIEFATADFWDEDFSRRLRCLLYDNSTDNADVVTFDYEAVQMDLLAGIEFFDPTLGSYTLVGQVRWLLSQIGEQGLNLAGTRTEVADDDCAACAGNWCCYVDLTEGVPEWLEVSGTHWALTSSGITSVQDGSHQFLDVIFTFPRTLITQLQVTTDQLDSAGTNISTLKDGATTIASDGMTNGAGTIPYTRDVGVIMDTWEISKHRAFSSTPETFIITTLVFRGNEYPIPCEESNCE